MIGSVLKTLVITMSDWIFILRMWTYLNLCHRWKQSFVIVYFHLFTCYIIWFTILHSISYLNRGCLCLLHAMDSLYKILFDYCTCFNYLVKQILFLVKYYYTCFNSLLNWHVHTDLMMNFITGKLSFTPIWAWKLAQDPHIFCIWAQNLVNEWKLSWMTLLFKISWNTLDCKKEKENN